VILRFKLILLLIALFCCSSVATAIPQGQGEFQKHLQSENRVVVFAEKYIDFGEFDKSNQLLEEAIRRFPGNDLIASLYGKSLYESGDRDRSEEYFMMALRLNSANIVAQQYIEQIRDVRKLSVSEESQKWIAIVKDKVGDLIVFVLSIWLGTSLNSIWRFFSNKQKWHKAKRRYARKDYTAVVRVLEYHVMAMEQGAINDCLGFMLSQDESSNVSSILEGFVIRDEDLKVLKRSLDLLVPK